ncbi:hypothetical protein [uncultured Cohaesibacter sp.]|uniref:hypothetical protein n=1 Tax=uncultured Cohaesibacter sp. TaxID=1002546 RepID=UPI0029C97283|nr:hypothetical protein [uncultured Cohaesibacter sp.]
MIDSATHKGISSARIRLHFDVHEPIELVDLTLSFQAIAREYRSFLVNLVRAQGGKSTDAEVKLYVTDIKNNCIWAELGSATEIMGALFSTMSHTNTFVDFAQHISAAVNYFKSIGRSGKPDIQSLPYSNKQIEIISDILKTAAKNKNGALGISVIDYETNEEKLTVKFDHNDALDARRGALLTSQELSSKRDADYKEVLMYFHQANIEQPRSEGRTGFRGVIKSISDKDLPVHFISDLDQDRISSLVSDPLLNPFKASYRVDVNVETDRNDKPRFYRVVNLHEIIPEE